jgi:hypothetical protein
MILEVLAAFFVSRPKEEGHQRSLLATVIAYAIVIGLVLVLLRSGLPQSVLRALQQAAAFFSAGNRTLSIPQAKVASNPSSMIILLSYYSILMFVVILLVSFSLFVLGFHKAFNYAPEFPSVDKGKQLRREALEVVQEALTELKATNGYHETILKCYKQMCKILSDKGFTIGLAQTPREFAYSISEKLRLGSEPVKGLTFLFEEARYSGHPIDDDKRALAVSELDSLERALADKVAGVS